MSKLSCRCLRHTLWSNSNIPPIISCKEQCVDRTNYILFLLVYSTSGQQQCITITLSFTLSQIPDCLSPSQVCVPTTVSTTHRLGSSKAVTYTSVYTCLADAEAYRCLCTQLDAGSFTLKWISVRVHVFRKIQNPSTINMFLCTALQHTTTHMLHPPMTVLLLPWLLPLPNLLAVSQKFYACFLKTQYAFYSHINYSVCNCMYCAVITIEATDEHFLERKVGIKSPTSNLVMLLTH
jgi:hypothetical protein